MSEAAGIDKDVLYGDFRREQAARGKLAMRAAHKALDIPEDDVQISANKTTTNNGIGARGATIIAMAAGLPAALLAFFLNRGPDVATTPPTAAPAASQEFLGIYEQRQPDGTWKETKREELKK